MEIANIISEILITIIGTIGLSGIIILILRSIIEWLGEVFS